MEEKNIFKLSIVAVFLLLTLVVISADKSEFSESFSDSALMARQPWQIIGLQFFDFLRTGRISFNFFRDINLYKLRSGGLASNNGEHVEATARPIRTLSTTSVLKATNTPKVTTLNTTGPILVKPSETANSTTNPEPHLGSVTVSGRVYDFTTGQGISDVSIYNCKGNTVNTKSDGTFSYVAPEDDLFCLRLINIEELGYSISRLNLESTDPNQRAQSYEWQRTSQYCKEGNCGVNENLRDRAFDSGYDFVVTTL